MTDSGRSALWRSTPAFGKAVAPCGAVFDGRAEALPYLIKGGGYGILRLRSGQAE
jgi:hypothetical protein